MKVILRYFFALLFFLIASTAFAKSGDTFRPYVSATWVYDDNFFKVDPDDSATIEFLGGKSSLTDQLTTLAAGMDVDWRVSRQHITMNAEVNKNTFAKHDELDYEGEKYNGTWNWQAGKEFSGRIGYAYNSTLASFVDNRTIGLLGAKQVRQNYFAGGKWLFHPRWRVGAELSGVEIDYKKSNTELNDRDDTSGEVTFEYISVKNNIIGLKYKETHSVYPARDFVEGSLEDNVYDLRQLLLTMDWRITGKSSLTGQIGWEELDNKHLDQRNFSGLSVRLAHTWFPNGKLRVRTDVWQEVNPSQSVIATYEKSEGIRVSPSWLLSAKNSINFKLEHEKRKLEGDPALVNSTSDTFNDTYNTASISWGYQINDNFDFQLGYEFSERDSNTDLRNFESNMVFSTVKAQW